MFDKTLIETPTAASGEAADQAPWHYDRAVRLLAQREHSRQELAQKLRLAPKQSQDFTPPSPEVLDALLDELENLNWLSDQRFAASFTRQRLLKGQGPVKVRYELKQRGVSDELIEWALEITPEEEGIDWINQATTALYKRFGPEASPTTPNQKSKMIRFLQQRGFSSEQTYQALQAAY
ncbi:regulatory protein RecX [Terasakiispira papahanaumokuakeensis]|uniref:regulatory protein RecX n=1 Tax=Terasakiispira papahanaumokuakeensis TaxID=197479 RepID=UPI000A5504E2|nr:regulatory protein RecX [Terasakiispira papahanaumokuakeensis]